MARNSSHLQIGSVVQVPTDVRINNGENIAAGLVTKIFKDDQDGSTRLNIRVILDTGADKRYDNIPFVNSKPDDIKEKLPTRVAFWPEG